MTIGLTIHGYTGDHKPIDINGVMTPNPRGLPPLLLRDPDKWVAQWKAEIDKCEPSALVLFNRPGGTPATDADPTTPEKLELDWSEYVSDHVFTTIYELMRYAEQDHKIGAYVGPIRQTENGAITINGDNYDDRRHFHESMRCARNHGVSFMFIDTAANVGAWERLEDIAESYGITLVGEGEGRDTPRNPNRVWCARSSKGPSDAETAKWTQFRRASMKDTDPAWLSTYPYLTNHGMAPYFVLCGGAGTHVDPASDLRVWKSLGYTLHPWTASARQAIAGMAAGEVTR